MGNSFDSRAFLYVLIANLSNMWCRSSPQKHKIMKKLGLLLTLVLIMTMKSHQVFAQSVTITLMPGWNWISYPTMDTLDFETAMGSFTPMVGDIVKSQWGQATYMSNGQWRGTISQFYPGYGYHYKSNRTMLVTVTFTAQQPAPQVIVTTAETTDITTNSATCGGNVFSSNGDYTSVTLKGVCWSTNPNPTFNDNYIEAGEGIGSFTVSMSELTIGTIYYVRAFAVTENGTFYGEQNTFSTKDGIPTLTTTDVTDISEHSAFVGGCVTDDGGLLVTDRGICWSITPNPTIADMCINLSNGIGSFSSRITGLSRNTTYYVRSYATNSLTTAYGNQLVFNTLNGWIDLGLPSGILWAISNIGADYPEDYGDYFAWGETEPKNTYSWNTYHFGSDYNKLSKYCNNPVYGIYGFTDNLTTLQLSDDAAAANWGEDWRMPTYDEWEELYQYTTQTWTTLNDVNGILFTASNGNCIFLPAAGYRMFNETNTTGFHGTYWSSSLDTDGPYNSWGFYFDSDFYMGQGTRYLGKPVRAVRSASQK